ncbi:Uncharacterized protein Rs2_02216 [Raphanus sativus]|nr:Uncharacterized protein Rs2_02216 [Raphanus sativus]
MLKKILGPPLATATSPSPGEAAASSSVVPMVSSDTGASTSVMEADGALEGDVEGDGEEAAAARPRMAKNTRPKITTTFWRPILLSVSFYVSFPLFILGFEVRDCDDWRRAGFDVYI